MTRSEELDKMSEEDKKKDILKNIKEHGAIRLDSRQAVGFWSQAVSSLKEDKKVNVEFIEDYEGQYSYYLITEFKKRRRKNKNES